MPQTSAFAGENARAFATASVLALLAMLACRLGIDLLPAAAFALPRPPRNLDFGVVALFVPLCALLLGIVAEATLLTLRGDLPAEARPPARAIPHWQDAGA